MTEKLQFIQVPILHCNRCTRKFSPKILPDEEIVVIPESCPYRDCRSKTWNIPNDELGIIKEKQQKNLLRGPGFRIKKGHVSAKVLEKYMPKKKKKIKFVICMICEIPFHDVSGLNRHQQRRHTGLCHACNRFNVVVTLQDGITTCLDCVKQ